LENKSFTSEAADLLRSVHSNIKEETSSVTSECFSDDKGKHSNILMQKNKF